MDGNGRDFKVRKNHELCAFVTLTSSHVSCFEHVKAVSQSEAGTGRLRTLGAGQIPCLLF